MTTGITEVTATVSDNPSAYVGELFAEHGRMVLGLSRLLLRDPFEAEDAAQQVFLSAHQAVLRGALPRDPHPWLAAITRHECRARLRARMREPQALPELPSDLPDPLAAAIHAADLQAIWAALGALPRRQRRALVLRELGGLSYRELGRALGVSHSAVESLLFRARRQAHALVAGANARFAALPLALKLGGAAVSVGIVATGASDLRPIRMPTVVAPQRVVEQRSAPAPSFHLEPLPAVHEVRSFVPHARHHGRRARHAEHARQAAETRATPDPIEEHVEQSSEGPVPAPTGPTGPTQPVASHEGPGDVVSQPQTGHHGDDGLGGSSGPDGGSGHSGPG